MIEVLKDLSPPALARAIEENMYATKPFFHGWLNMERYEGKDLSWCLTDVFFPSCNVVFRTRLAPERVDKTIEYLSAKASRRNVPLQWYITRDTQPADLDKYLTAHGFTTRGDGAGMAIDLKAIKEDVHPTIGLVISEVKDGDTLKTWCRTVRIGFDIPERADNDLYEWFSKDIELKQPCKFYLGSLDGKPVASSMVYFGTGVAGLYFVATVPEARNKGIGFAISRRPLEEAFKMGYRAGILQASKMGEPVYRQMGFKEYCRIGSYTWMPKL